MTLLDYYINVLCSPWSKAGDNIEYKWDSLDHILYFQGSNEKSDWKYNFDFPVRAYRNSDVNWKVHRGFMSAWKSVENIILPLILDYDDVTIVGYSHGGALACLAHEDYWYHKYHQPTTIIFGAPRILWYKNANKVITRFTNIKNIQNIGDTVTKVPFRWMGFVDIGVTTRIGSKYWYTGHNPEQYIGGLYGK